jgi:hypothetical protein
MKRDPSYSPDLEIDHDGLVKYTRDVHENEIIQVPFHMLKLIVAQSRQSATTEKR